MDKDGCIACGLCVEICPEVFKIGEDGLAEPYVDEVPEENRDKAIDAQEECPVSVIKVD